MHRNTTSCVGLVHGRLINIHIQDWFILFQQNSFLISDFMRLKPCQKRAFLNTGNGVIIFSFLFISPWLYHHIIYCWLSSKNRLLYLGIFFNFAQVTEKYVIRNKNPIMEYVEKNGNC